MNNTYKIPFYANSALIFVGVFAFVWLLILASKLINS